MLRTLGGLFWEKAPDFRKKKPLLLLAYLALEGPRSRRHLVELFWPEASDALNSLSVALAHLRRAGVPLEGEEVLSVQVPCDALDLEAALARQDLEEAFRLYRGRFLEGADEGLSPELEEWVWGKREALALSLWAACRKEAEALAGLGFQEEAQALLLRARALPGVGAVVEEEPALRPFPPSVRRAFFAVALAGLTRAAELLGLRAEDLEFLVEKGLLDPQGRPKRALPLPLEGRRVALELACALPLSEAAPLYGLARGLWEEKDLPRARLALLRLVRERVEEGPQEALDLLKDLAPDAEVLLLRARALERLGRYREALDLLEELPEGPERSALRGVVLLRLGQVEEAEREAEAAMRGGPYAQAEALNLKGMKLLGQGRFREAAETFSRAAVRFLMAGEEVRHLAALSNRAVALAELGQGEEAFAEVLEAVGERRFLRARVYLNLGVLRERQGQMEEAERLYREALRLAKEGREWVLTAAVLANLAELEGERASLEEAIALLEEARYTALAERYRSRLRSFQTG